MSPSRSHSCTSKRPIHLFGHNIAGEHHSDNKARRAAKESYALQPQETYLPRALKAGDLNFVYDSWASSFRHGAASDKIPQDIYKVEQRSRIIRVMKYSRIRCLSPSSDPSHITGWICFSPPSGQVRYPILHYILIHPNQQMKGLGKQLLAEALATKRDPEDPMWCSHWTVPMRKLIPHWNLIYNPYLLEVLK